MSPENPAVGLLIQFCDAHPIFVRLHMLCHDIHGDLAQVQVGADARRRSDSRGFQYVLHHLGSQFPRRKPIHLQITAHIHEHLINRVHMDVLRRNIFEIHVKYLCTVLKIQCHPRRRCHIG